MSDVEIAHRWRKSQGYAGKGGVVVLFDGQVQSWVNALRNPEDWQAGCVAVDEDGNRWVSVGGIPNTPFDAANEWRSIAD